MIKDPGHVPDGPEMALLCAAQLVVTEVNARIDAGDLEGALDLYAEDTVLEAARGKPAIHQAMLHSSAAGAGKPACHVVTNLRAITNDDAMVVNCNLVAYLLDSPRPYGANVILNLKYILKPSSAGNLRIVEQRVEGYDLTYA